MFQNIVKFFVLFFIFANTAFATLRSDMNPTNGVEAGNPVLSQATGAATDNGALMTVFAYIRDFIFDLVWIVAIGVFLYFGFKMISAQGNPEELKKVMSGFLYAVIGLAIIPLSWAMVRLVSSLNF